MFTTRWVHRYRTPLCTMTEDVNYHSNSYPYIRTLSPNSMESTSQFLHILSIMPQAQSPALSQVCSCYSMQNPVSTSHANIPLPISYQLGSIVVCKHSENYYQAGCVSDPGVCIGDLLLLWHVPWSNIWCP